MFKQYDFANLNCFKLAEAVVLNINYNRTYSRDFDKCN